MISIKIVSPEKLVFQEDGFESVTVPTENGEITILPGHIPLVSVISPGEIIARKGNKEISLVTTKGFMRLEKNGELFVLSDYAVRSEDIEVAKVEAAKKKAEEMMKEKKSEKDFIIAEAELRKTILELKVARRKKSPGAKV